MFLGLGKIAEILEKSKNARTLITALFQMDNIFILIQVGAKSIRRVAALNDHPTFIKVRNFSYCPQTKFARVMISLFVCPRGGGVSVQMGVGQGGGSLSRGVSIRETALLSYGKERTVRILLEGILVLNVSCPIAVILDWLVDLFYFFNVLAGIGRSCKRASGFKHGMHKAVTFEVPIVCK